MVVYGRIAMKCIYLSKTYKSLLFVDGNQGKEIISQSCKTYICYICLFISIFIFYTVTQSILACQVWKSYLFMYYKQG